LRPDTFIDVSVADANEIDAAAATKGACHHPRTARHHHKVLGALLSANELDIGSVNARRRRPWWLRLCKRRRRGRQRRGRNDCEKRGHFHDGDYRANQK
jgi:hypothetical protein